MFLECVKVWVGGKYFEETETESSTEIVPRPGRRKVEVRYLVAMSHLSHKKAHPRLMRVLSFYPSYKQERPSDNVI